MHLFARDLGESDALIIRHIPSISIGVATTVATKTNRLQHRFTPPVGLLCNESRYFRRARPGGQIHQDSIILGSIGNFTFWPDLTAGNARRHQCSGRRWVSRP